jgi:hypothetical protein
MRRLVFAELVVLAAAAFFAFLLLTVHCCRRGWSSSKGPPSPTDLLPVTEPRQLPGATKERPLERLRRVLLRLCSRRSRVEPAAASAGTSPGAQGMVVPVQPAQQAGPEEEVAAWRERWFDGPVSRALYTIDEESSTSSWTPTAVSEGDVQSQCGGDRQEPETPFYTPPASPQHEAEQSEHRETS